MATADGDPRRILRSSSHFYCGPSHVGIRPIRAILLANAFVDRVKLPGAGTRTGRCEKLARRTLRASTCESPGWRRAHELLGLAHTEGVGDISKSRGGGVEPLRKRRLKTSVFFLFLSDISGLFATFLPMKSVFILAASDVPRFFPTVLVEGGPTVAALALVAAAVVFAFVAWVSKKLVLALEVAYLRAQQPGTLLPGAKHSPTVKAPQRAVGDSHLLVAFITGAGIGIISWLFVSGLLAWLAVSFLVVMVKSSRAPLRAPLHQRRRPSCAYVAPVDSVFRVVDYRRYRTVCSPRVCSPHGHHRNPAQCRTGPTFFDGSGRFFGGAE